jgi:5,10-methylenetetrahydromethanopterin reductase
LTGRDLRGSIPRGVDRSIRLDLRVPVGLPLPQVAEFIGGCEEAGLDGVGVHDHPHSGRDAYLALALAATRTRRLWLYPATSSPIARHPLLLASLANSLDEIAPGRVRLTVAPGFLAVRSIGQPRATVGAMREALVTIRRLLAGETVRFGATETRLRNPRPAPPPVYLLAAGPRMVELAGEAADGALLLVGLDPRAVAAARQHLAEGARRAARDLAGFRSIFIVPVAVEDDLATAREWPRRWCGPGLPWLSYPSRSNLYWLRLAGLDLPDPPTPEAISEELAGRICEAFGLFGPAGYCRERLLRAHEEAGVDHVFLFPAHTVEGSYAMPTREVAAFRRP